MLTMVEVIITSERKVMVLVMLVCSPVCPSVCPSNYFKSDARICTKLLSEVYLGPRNNRLDFAHAPDYDPDLGSGLRPLILAEVCSL